MRCFRKVKLKPDTDYIFKVNYRFEAETDDPLDRDVRIGAFEDNEYNDIFINAKNRPADGINPDSLLYLYHKDLSNEYTNVTVRFNSKEKTYAFSLISRYVESGSAIYEGFGETLSTLQWLYR